MALSQNAVQRILANESGLQPVVQIIDIKGIQANKPMAASVAPQRYRLTLSDGTHHMQAMLATQKNQMVQQGEIKKMSIVKLKEFMANDLKGTQILIVLELDVLGCMDQTIGSPVSYGAQEPAPQQAAQQVTLPGRPQQPASHTTQPYNAQAQSSAFPYSPATSAPYQHPPTSSTVAPSAHVGSALSYTSPAKTAPYGKPAYQPPQSGYQPYTAFQNSRPVAREDGLVNFMPIADLHPYANKWTIKARVTSKSQIRRWSNAKGEGTLFSADLLDKDGGEVRCTFFKDACDKFYGLLEEGKVYYFSNGRLKVANRQYTSINHQYEITFDVSADITPAPEDQAILNIKYHFRKIGELKEFAANQTVDVLAVVKHAGDLQELTSTKRGGIQLQKRDLTLADDSMHEVKLTLWGEKAMEDGAQWANTPLVAVKGARISDFNGISLGMTQSSNMQINPDIPEAHTLYSWFQKNGSAGTISLSSGGDRGGGSMAFAQRKTVSAIKQENLGYGEKPDYLALKATINYIKHDSPPYYSACITENCNKKVSETMDGGWFCERCNTQHPRCAHRYIISLTASDYTGTTWLTVFNEQGEMLLGGTKADYLQEMRGSGNEQGYEAVFQQALFKTYIVKIRVKAEQVNEESRVKSSIVNLQPLDFVSESRSLIEAIEKLL